MRQSKIRNGLKGEVYLDYQQVLIMFEFRRVLKIIESWNFIKYTEQVVWLFLYFLAVKCEANSLGDLSSL